MTKAVLARQEAGLSVEEAAKRARIGVAYLRQVERQGANYPLAQRLARIYGCSIHHFLNIGAAKPPQNRSSAELEPSGDRTSQETRS